MAINLQIWQNYCIYYLRSELYVTYNAYVTGYTKNNIHFYVCTYVPAQITYIVQFLLWYQAVAGMPRFLEIIFVWMLACLFA